MNNAEDTITITISRKELLEYITNSLIYEALETGGVDNWEWYGESYGDSLEWYINDMNLDPDSDFFDVASKFIDEMVTDNKKE